MDTTALQSIANECLARFEDLFKRDERADMFGNILALEIMLARFVRDLGRLIIQRYLDVRAEQATRKRDFCPCSKGITVHRKTKWTRETPLGPVSVTDPYLRCRTCQVTARPLHAFIGTHREVWSLDVVEKAVDLASDESAGSALDKLKRHHPGVDMDRNTALRLLHKHGAQAREFIDDKLTKARALAELPPREGGPGVDILEVEYDGGMVPVATLEALPVEADKEPERTPVRGLPKRRKNCHWREVGVGLVQQPGLLDRFYSAGLSSGQTDKAFNDLLALAILYGWTEDTFVRGIADGAIYIRQRLEDTFNVGRFEFVLDRPHCKEHLSDAGDALEKHTEVPAQQWAKAAMQAIEDGDVNDIIDELRKVHLASGDSDKTRDDDLRREANYFQRNADAVDYPRYRAEGLSSASSEVESAHRSLIQRRLKLPGAWWHPDHVDDIIALRLLKANGWWDAFWDKQRFDWFERAGRFAAGEVQPQAA